MCIRDRREEIKARLLALREPQTGERVVAEVWKREEIYSGPYVDWSPDLRVIWQEYPEQKRTYFNAGEPWADAAFAYAGQTGDHARDGILYAFGPGVRQGVRLPRLSIMDLAPTVPWRRGAQVVHGNPVVEVASTKTIVPHDFLDMALFRSSQTGSLDVQVAPGGDMALMRAIAKVVFEAADTDPTALDREFLAEHTVGLEEYLSLIHI